MLRSTRFVARGRIACRLFLPRQLSGPGFAWALNTSLMLWRCIETGLFAGSSQSGRRLLTNVARRRLARDCWSTLPRCGTVTGAALAAIAAAFAAVGLDLIGHGARCYALGRNRLRFASRRSTVAARCSSSIPVTIAGRR